MFDYDTAFADEDNHVFPNTHINNEIEEVDEEDE